MFFGLWNQVLFFYQSEKLEYDHKDLGIAGIVTAGSASFTFVLPVMLSNEVLSFK